MSVRSALYSMTSAMLTCRAFSAWWEDLTGFGHFTYELLQLLGDDYPRSPIKLYALRTSQQAASPQVRPSPPSENSMLTASWPMISEALSSYMCRGGSIIWLPHQGAPV